MRTYRAERNQTVIILLDNGRVMAGRVADVPRVEHAMDAAMMLTAVATRLGDRAGLVAFDRDVRAVVAPGHGRDQLGLVTEAMYELEPGLAESDYRGAFATTLARFRRRALLVVLTDLVEQAVGESLLPALPLISRNHLVVVAAVRDPEVVRWAAATPDRRRRRLPQGGGRAGRSTSAAAPPPACAASAPRWSTRPRQAGPAPGRRLPQGQGHRPPLTRPLLRPISELVAICAPAVRTAIATRTGLDGRWTRGAMMRPWRSTGSW